MTLVSALKENSSNQEWPGSVIRDPFPLWMDVLMKVPHGCLLNAMLFTAPTMCIDLF